MDNIILLESKDIPKNVVEAPTDNLSKLFVVAQHMEKICLDKKGIGLSAVQVGIPWKFFIYLDDKNNFNYMVNCEYKPLDEEKYVSIEGCLSISGPEGFPRRFKVYRNSNVIVFGKKLILEDEGLKLVDFSRSFSKGLESAVFQHEIDHQNDILISDIGEEIFISNYYKLG
jgi:peptide deformylase